MTATNDVGNAVTNGVRNDGVTLPHTTPHHTTSTSTSSRTDAQTRGRAIEQPVIARLNAIDRWDALAVIVAACRPDWRITDVLAAVTRDPRPPRDVVAAAIACALDADVRHPGAIAHRATGTATPTPPNQRRDVLCPVHLDDAATCRGCAADRKATKEAQ